MSKIKADHVFTSESVSEGHPDKVADQISDAVLDACLQQDPQSRVACEVLCTTDLIVISGEITTSAVVDFEKLARKVVREIGYNDPECGFAADTCQVLVRLHKQSPDIAMGVDSSAEKEQGAGDQGMMFGYASSETDEAMPATILFAHKIIEEFTRIRHTETDKYPFLRPDAKCQVSMFYHQGKPQKITTIVLSHQHSEDMERSQLEQLVKTVVKKVIPARFLSDDIVYHINPTGRFVIGGPAGDTGLTGRKIIVDTYGGVGSHGGGAFSGKDPSKVDRSAAYMCRYIAKNIVTAGLAEKCEIQVSYAIGFAKPLSVNVDTYGTGRIPDEKLAEIVTGTFDLSPAGILKKLDLQHPAGWCYREAARNGHFGRCSFPWEKTDCTELLLKASESFFSAK